METILGPSSRGNSLDPFTLSPFQHHAHHQFHTTLWLLNELASTGGFITQPMALALARQPEGLRLQVLLRGERGRFLCLVSELTESIAKMESMGDPLRDVSLPAGAPLWKALMGRA